MTDVATSPRFSRVLSLGARASWSGWATFLGAFLASAAAALAVSASAGLFWLLAVPVDLHTLAIGAVGLGLLWFTAQAIRAVLVGANLTQASARLRRDAVPTLREAVGASASRSFAWLLYGLLLEGMRAGWQLLTLGLAAFAFGHALFFGAHGLLGAAGLALAVTVAVALWLSLALWVDYAFARSIVRLTASKGGADPGSSYLVTLFDSVGVLWRSPWPPLAILVVTALVAGALELLVGLAPGQLVGQGGLRALLIFGALLTAALTAFIDTGAVLLRLGAFAVLELEAARELPEPPRVEPIVEAAAIVDALPSPQDPGPTPA
jgi:hypothetical protein